MPSSFLYDLWRTFFPAYLTAHFGIQAQGEAHDAMTDIRMTMEIYRRLVSSGSAK